MRLFDGILRMGPCFEGGLQRCHNGPRQGTMESTLGWSATYATPPKTPNAMCLKRNLGDTRKWKPKVGAIWKPKVGSIWKPKVGYRSTRSLLAMSLCPLMEDLGLFHAVSRSHKVQPGVLTAAGRLALSVLIQRYSIHRIMWSQPPGAGICLRYSSF